MGQHKYNPTAIKAKNGEIPPKPPRMSKREQMMILDAMIVQKMREITGLDKFESEIGQYKYFK